MRIAAESSHRAGFALITSLLILVVVFALGVSAFFLTSMNLGIAENVRTHATAKANANAGAEVAIGTLIEAYESNSPKQFPSTFTDADLPRKDDGATRYTLIPCDPSVREDHLVRICIRGFGPNGAEYTTEVLLGAQAVNDPKYSFGMISEDNVNIAGASGSFIDAGLHTNNNLWLPGWSDDQFQYCTVDRDEDGYCPDGALATYAQAEDMPLSVWEGGGQGCGPGGGIPFCQGGSVKDEYVVADEVIVNVDYDERRHRAAGGTVADDGTINDDGMLDPGGTIDMVACLAEGSTNALCYDGTEPQTYTSDMVNGRTIIAQGDVSITCGTSCDLSDTVIISTEGTVTLGGGIETATDTRVFSEGNLSVGRTQWFGQSTLASAGDIYFDGTASTFEAPTGTSIGFSIIAEGDITTTGGGGTQVVGTYVSGGTFNWAGGGGTYIRGGVLVKETVNIAGGYTIDAALPTSNPDLDNTLGNAQVLSQR